jgi:hypothetical protein
VRTGGTDGTGPPSIIYLYLHNVLGLITLRPLGDVELDLIAFVKRFETAGLDGGMVDKNIISGSAADKSVALLVIEPLDCSLLFHLSSSL